jgi:hypothetical protein
MTSHDPDFLAKAAEVCGLYRPPEGAVVFSVDEKTDEKTDQKTGMQACSRVNPIRPPAP